MVTLHLPFWAGVCVEIATKAKGPRGHTIVHQQHFLKGTDNTRQGSTFSPEPRASQQDSGHTVTRMALPPLYPISQVLHHPFRGHSPQDNIKNRNFVSWRRTQRRERGRGKAWKASFIWDANLHLRCIKLRNFQPPLWRCYAPSGGATFFLWGGNMAINIVI